MLLFIPMMVNQSRFAEFIKQKAWRILFIYIKSDQLPKHSMKYMLEHISTQLIPIPEDQKKYFRNFNAHAELNGL